MKIISTHKKDVVHISNGILLSHIKEPTVPCEDIRMDLETVLQSERSQNEKNKYRILTHVCGIQNNGLDDLIFKREIETQM